jgi:hypothetical protein
MTLQTFDPFSTPRHAAAHAEIQQNGSSDDPFSVLINEYEPAV